MRPWFMNCFGCAGELTMTLFCTLKHSLFVVGCAPSKCSALVGLEISRSLWQGEETVGIIDLENAWIRYGLLYLLLDANVLKFDLSGVVAAPRELPLIGVKVANDLLFGIIWCDKGVLPDMFWCLATGSACALCVASCKIAIEALLLGWADTLRITGASVILLALCRDLTKSSPGVLFVNRLFSLSITGRALLIVWCPEGGNWLVILCKGGLRLKGATGGFGNFAASFLVVLSPFNWFSSSLTWIE